MKLTPKVEVNKMEVLHSYEECNIWRGDKRFWSPIALTAGLTIVFFGISYMSASKCVGWIDIGFGIALLIIGFATAPLKSQNG